MSTGEDTEHRIPRWLQRSLQGASVLIGAGLIVAGNVTQFGAFRADTTSGGFWAAVLVNLGTTVLLAGVLVWFERRITRTAARASRIVARAEADRVVAEAVQPIRANIADINDLLRDRRNERNTHRIELAQTIASAGELRAVAELLRDATRRGAVAPAVDGFDDNVEGSGQMTVRAGVELDAPFVTFRAFTDRATGVVLIPEAIDDAFLWWEDDAPVGEAIDDLVQKMVDHNLGAASQAIDVPVLLQNLATALIDAIKAREGDPDAWIQSTPVYEVFADGWAVTADGVEMRERGLVIPRDRFAHFQSSRPGAARLVGNDVGDPPDGVPHDVWALAEERGSRYFRPRLGG